VLVLTAIVALFRSSFSLRWFLTFCLAIPLFYFHLTIGLIDLFTASMVLTGFAGLTGLLTGGPPVGSTVLMMAGCAAAMSSKMQAWVPVFVMVIAGVYALVVSVRSRRLSRSTAFALIFILVLLVSFFPARNFLLFGNPTYPIPMPFMHGLPANEEPSDNRPSYLLDLPTPASFLASAFEVNRLLTEAQYSWGVDQSDDESAVHNLMGGWFFVTVIVMCFFLAIGFFRRAIDRKLLFIFLLEVIVASFISEFFMLRYVLFIPLMAFFLFALSLNRYPTSLRHTLEGCLALCALYVALHLGNHFWSIQVHPPAWYAPDEAVRFWDEHPQSSPKHPILLDRTPETIFWSGPTFAEIHVKQENAAE
jgi:hypothetical protein